LIFEKFLKYWKHKYVYRRSFVRFGGILRRPDVFTVACNGRKEACLSMGNARVGYSKKKNTSV
jgi:hypothetical protein